MTVDNVEVTTEVASRNWALEKRRGTRSLIAFPQVGFSVAWDREEGFVIAVPESIRYMLRKVGSGH